MELRNTLRTKLRHTFRTKACSVIPQVQFRLGQGPAETRRRKDPGQSVSHLRNSAKDKSQTKRQKEQGSVSSWVWTCKNSSVETRKDRGQSESYFRKSARSRRGFPALDRASLVHGLFLISISYVLFFVIFLCPLSFLFNVYCVLFIVYYLLFIVYYLLFIVYC